MREQARDKGRLQDMIEAANNIAEFVAGVTFEQFVGNKMLFFAVMKNVEIIGEAAYMLTKEFQESHPQVRWVVIWPPFFVGRWMGRWEGGKGGWENSGVFCG
ncbi:MAG: DUF86 domain-containing protein [Bacteroidales bacterium]|nr:DUF86 domain-containing protein [Bacteroidales bacterium]